MNQIIKNITIFSLIITMIFSFTACGGGTVLATVGDVEITQEQIEGYTNYNIFTTYEMTKAEFESQYGEQYVEYMNGLSLSLAVEVEVIKQHFEKEGVQIIPDDFDEKFASYKKALLSQGDDIQNQLHNAGIDDSTLKFFFGAQQFYMKQFREDINKEDPATDAEIEKFYKENKDDLVSPAQIKVSHILISDEKHSDEGRTSIEAIKAKIEGGDSFADMAKEYSNDGSAPDGGDLGWIDENINYVREFKDAAFALDKGEMSDIVETEHGFHLIKVTDKKPEHQKTLEEATEMIKQEIQYAKYLDGVESLKNEIGVVFTDKGKELIDVIDSNTEE